VSRERGQRLVAQNRRARHDYAISETFEAGLVLSGTEVKSLRAGRATLGESYATIKDGEAWIVNLHIPEYHAGTWTNHPPRRTRKLLLHRKELSELARAVDQKGMALVPLSLYFKDGYAKVELGLGVGRKTYDKRQAIAARDAKREEDRAVRARVKGRGR
jgi:SsrA-binding protein